MFLIVKQKIINNKIIDEPFMYTNSIEKAHLAVQQIRKQQNNQLCYFKKA